MADEMEKLDLSKIPAGVLPGPVGLGPGPGMTTVSRAPKVPKGAPKTLAPAAPVKAKKGKFKAVRGRKLKLQRLRQRHHRILEAAATGRYTNRELAAKFGVAECTISNTLTSEWGKLKLAHLTQRYEEASMQVGAAIQEMAVDALMVMDEVLHESADDRLRQKTAMDILAMGGHGAVQKHDFTHRPGAPTEDIEDIKKRAVEQRAERLRQRVEEGGEILLQPGDKSPTEAGPSDSKTGPLGADGSKPGQAGEASK